jgi:hypothetical protein
MSNGPEELDAPSFASWPKAIEFGRSAALEFDRGHLGMTVAELRFDDQGV